MLFKTVPAQIKAAGPDDGLEEGQFEAIVSVFDNIDSYGDVVRKGAFEETLDEWAQSGNPIPVYYSHRMDDPDFNIGEVLDAKETNVGLWVKAAIDLGDDASRVAKQSYRLMKGRRLTQFSFAYDVLDGGWVDKTEDGVDSSFYELRRLKLYEVGPTPIGANSETELLGVKHLAESLTLRQKAGAVLSAKNKDALIAAREAIDSVLKNAEPEEDGKTAQSNPPANTEDRKSGNVEEPKGLDPARLQRLLDHIG